MDRENSNIHKKIAESVGKQADDAKQSVGQIVQQGIQNMGKYKLPNVVYQDQVRGIRNTAIGIYKGIKLNLITDILQAINEAVDVTPIRKLQEQYAELQRFQKDKKIAEERQKQLSDELEKDDYKKFQIYGNPNKTSVGDDLPEIADEDIEQAYSDYLSKRKWSFVKGILITILCTLADYTIINSFFQASNVTVTASMISAVIVSAVLDAPPYIIGVLWTTRDEKRQFWRLRSREDSAGVADEIKRYNIMMILSAIAFIVICIIYIAVRLITFFGGGDFNVAFHALLERQFMFQNTNFSSADLLTILTPLGTSVVAFSVGMLVNSSYVEYVRSAIALINKGLELKQADYREKVISYETELEILRRNMAVSKDEVWIFYMGHTQRPKEDEIFRSQVIRIFQEVNVSLYRQTYENCCDWLRSEAELELDHINREMAVYAAEPTSIISMPVSDKERELLDHIWVTKNGQKQHSETIGDIQNIENQVKKVTDRLQARMNDGDEK